MSYYELTLNKDKVLNLKKALQDQSSDDQNYFIELCDKFLENYKIKTLMMEAVKIWLTDCLKTAWDTEGYKHIRDLCVHDTPEVAFNHCLYNMMGAIHESAFVYENGVVEWNKYSSSYMPFPAKKEQKEELAKYVEKYIKTTINKEI